jgi:uncharacterized protein (TIGR03437 family)
VKCPGRSLSFITCLILLSLIVGFGVRSNEYFGGSARRVAPDKRAQIIKAYGQLPLPFEANRGQVGRQVKFIARSSGQTLFLTAHEAVLSLRSSNIDQPIQSATVKMSLVGGNAQSRMVGLDELPGKSNYFAGADPQRWYTNIANYARVKYDEVYPGIDLIWHGNQQRLEHDFIVAPGADAQRIRWAFAGAQALRVDAQGELVLQTAAGEMRLLKPQAWQEVAGERRPVACAYAIKGKQQIGFKLGAYDRRRELIIDPVLLYASFLGGSGFEQGVGIALDPEGNIYVAGVAASTDFPGPSSIRPAADESSDAFVVKLNPNASAIIYGTWLGGAGRDVPTALAVDQSGNAYVTGSTGSADFPVTAGVLQRTLGGGFGDGFVTKLNPAGSALVYSTYLGGSGSDFTTGIVLDSSGLFKTSDSGASWNDSGVTLSTTQVRSLTIDPTNSNTLYAGTLVGVAKSTDGGVQWRLTGQGGAGGALGSVQVVAVDPSNPNIIYAGGEFGGIYKSTNGGDSYTSIFNDLPADTSVNFFYDILIDPTAPATVYMGTDGGAYKSLNGGTSWARMQGLDFGATPSQRPRVNRLIFDPANRAILFAATNRGLFKTTNGGNTWVGLNNGLGPSNFGSEVFALVVDPTMPNTLYAGLAGFNGGLFKTTDGGATWRASNAGLFLAGQTVALSVNALAINPSAPMTLYAGTSAGVYKTVDGGATWTAANNGLPLLAVNALALDLRAPANLYAGMNGGNDAFAAKLNAQGTALGWLTYLGGASNDEAFGITLDKDGNVYLVGYTTSANFPTANPLQAAGAGFTDAFIANDTDLSAFAVGNFDADGRADFVTIDGRRSGVVIHWNRCATSGLTIYGQALDRTTPIGLGNVTVRLSGARTATTTTDLGGNYEFTGLPPGNYTVTVERAGVEFNPASQTLNNVTADRAVNFSGARKGTTVSAASFTGQAVAPNSVASIFGPEMSRGTEVAQEQPLPIRLANQYVYFKDSAGVERAAQLFFVSPGQINFLIPGEAALGPASIHIFSPVNSNEPDTTDTLLIERVAPGLFAANANGAGVAAAVALRVKAGGAQSFEPVARFDGTRFVSVPLDLGPATDQIFLILFGTGFRNHNGLANVSARVDGTACEVFYAGAQGSLAGLDQLNLLLPRSLAGRGELDLVLTVEGKQANTVRVNIK